MTNKERQEIAKQKLIELFPFLTSHRFKFVKIKWTGEYNLHVYINGAFIGYFDRCNLELHPRINGKIDMPFFHYRFVLAKILKVTCKLKKL